MPWWVLARRCRRLVPLTCLPFCFAALAVRWSVPLTLPVGAPILLTQANNCAKILDGLLRQDLGIAAGSFFSHAVRAANGMLPQARGWSWCWLRSCAVQQSNDCRCSGCAWLPF